MSVIREIFPDREAWLSNRNSYLGASEIACTVGIGFQTALSLWEEKRGIKKHADLSTNERVKFGNDAEPVLRDLYRVMYPEYELAFTPFLVVRQDDPKYGFLSDTPDGELVEKETGRRGLYESKTATCLGRSDWEKWNGKVPQKYYCQICQGMYCGDYEYADIFAMLRNSEGDAEIRRYHFERADCEESIEELKEAGYRFWKCVQSGTLPPAPIPMFY